MVYIQPELCKYTGRTIYKLIFPDKKVYIGLATVSHKRIDGHKKEAYAKTDGKWTCNTKCKMAIREFGWDNLKVEIMEFVPKWTSLRDRERYWIAQYQSWKEEYGYNSNKGGGGVIRHAAEAKAKISAANMGKTHTEEHKAKISAAAIGRTHTTEAKAKISAGLMGRTVTEETRAKLSKPVTSCKILEEYANGTQLVEFVSYASAHEAERKTQVNHGNISNCCLKKNKSAGGFLWFYTEENHPPQIIWVGEHIVPRIGDKPMPGNEQRKRAVISTSPGGEKQRHKSVSAAARTLSKSTGKKFDHSNISKCCSSKYKQTHHHGYTFCYE